MGQMILPDASQWINAFEVGKQRREADQQNRARQTYGQSLMTGDWKGAASAVAGYDPQLAVSTLKYGEGVDTEARRKGYGSTFATDPQGAVRAAQGAGDFEIAADLQEAIGKADEAKVAQARRTASRVAEIVAPIGEMADMGQRKAYIQTHRDELIGAGYTPEQIDAFEPTDANLATVYTQAVGLASWLDRNKPQVVGRAVVRTDPVTGRSTVQYRDPETAKLGEGESVVQYGGVGGDSGGGGKGGAGGGFDAFYQSYLGPVEGGYAPNDGNGAPVNYGINQRANPDVDVKNLTPEQAKQITYERYWKPSGADTLPAGLAEVQADTAFNMGVDTAKSLLQQSGGDVGRYLALREQKYRAIAEANPDKARFLPTWLDRNNRLAAYVGGQGGGQSVQGGGPRVIAQGPPKQKARTLSPEEAQARGFLPGSVVQELPDGTLRAAQSPNNQASPRKAEADLRKEFNGRPEVKAYREVTAAYRNVDAAATNVSAAGDLSLIFAYMKMLDPESVVREGEFATAQNAAGVPDRVVNLYNKALNGQRLNDTQRQDFVSQARSLYANRKSRFDEIAGEFRSYAMDYGVDPNRVVTVERPAGATGPRTIRGATPEQNAALAKIQIGGKRGSPTNPYVPRNKREYDGLPAGAHYVDGDGQIYTKGGQ